MKRILLDTNAYSEYLTGNQDVFHVISKADFVLISVIVLGELYAGFRGGNKCRENLEILRRFLSKPTVTDLPITEETSEIFGQTKNNLRITGTPIPINDVWIASQAIETGSVLITFDDHFENVKGLRIWETFK